MRNMSFAATIPQMYDRSKTVTRRRGWKFLCPGDEVMAVEKSMGLKKGEKIKRIHTIRILDVRQEPLWLITEEDVAQEGFPLWRRWRFLRFLRTEFRCKIGDSVTRIEFEHLEA